MSKRMIEVSTDVYAAIWTARQTGENSEDEVLQRVLQVKPTTKPVAKPEVTPTGHGYFDNRNSVAFEEGFKIFRDYKGKTYEAIATAGRWVRTDNGKSYPTLNQLNGSIAAGAENVWNGSWKYRTTSGKVLSIDTLRH